MAATAVRPPERDEAAVESRPLRLVVHREWALALEVVALTSFVFARPTLASLGRSPETFLSRGADWTDIVMFALVLVLGPPAVLVAVGAASGLAGRRVRDLVQAVVVGALATLVAWQVGGQFTTMSLRPLGGPASLAVGVGVAVLRLRTASLGTFLRYASIGALVFLGQFLVASPAAAIVLGGRHGGIDAEATEALAAAVGDDAPPVVVLVFDGMPTNLLLDGQGRIDAGLYPNLAALAGTSTWYRNHTTVAPMTLQAVPAILTGQVQDSMRSPVTSVYPHNLFTLLGGVYDIHASEPITGLCPVSVCPVADGSPLPELFRDAREVWEQQVQALPTVEHFIPGAFEDRYGRFAAWVDAQDFSRGDRPDAFVVHTLLPHDPWGYLPDGTRYASSPEPRGLFAYTWGETGAAVGRQRHMLQMQTADALVGRVMDELRAAGTFDDALVVVTADHGYAFEPDSSMRGVTKDNLADILWTPLIVKSPGQATGTVDDRNVLTVDILPTIADELGVDLRWDELDGVPADSADRDPADKSIADWGWSTLRADDRGPLAVDGEAGFARVLESDAVAGEGPLALWDRTGQAHGELVGRDVDDLDRGEPRSEVVSLPDVDRWARVDPAWPPLEVAATAPLRSDLSLAVAVNGTVAAVVPTEPTPFGVASVHAMLWPGAVVAGSNEITVYAIGGTRDAPVLHQLGVEASPPG